MLILHKVPIFWEGHNILKNLHLTFVLYSASQKLGEDFANFCGLLRIYEIYEASYEAPLTRKTRLLFSKLTYVQFLMARFESQWKSSFKNTFLEKICSKLNFVLKNQPLRSR